MPSIYDKGSPPLYADRNPRAQGQHYLNHVFAMTHEGLHAKSDIAAELAHRDIEIEQLRADAKRLDFVLGGDAFIYSQTTDAGVTVFQLWNQDEDENFRVLSGEGAFFKTPREAIDAAIAAQKEN